MKINDNPNSPIFIENTCIFYKDTIFLTKEGYYVRLVEYINKHNVIIEFLCSGWRTSVYMVNLKSGSIKYPFHQNKYGGYFGVGKYTKHGYPKIYDAWMNMLKRVNNPYSNPRNYSYESVTVINEWYNYQKFAFWYDNYLSSLNPVLYDHYQIDKDILQFDRINKLYSPNTCCLVPDELNKALSNNTVIRVSEPDLPIGVTCNGKSSYSINISLYGSSPYFGSFKTSIEAFEKYKEIKELYIKELANKYYSINGIKLDVYNALINIKIKPFNNK